MRTSACGYAGVHSCIPWSAVKAPTGQACHTAHRLAVGCTIALSCNSSKVGGIWALSPAALAAHGNFVLAASTISWRRALREVLVCGLPGSDQVHCADAT